MARAHGIGHTLGNQAGRNLRCTHVNCYGGSKWPVPGAGTSARTERLVDGSQQSTGAKCVMRTGFAGFASKVRSYFVTKESGKKLKLRRRRLALLATCALLAAITPSAVASAELPGRNVTNTTPVISADDMRASSFREVFGLPSTVEIVRNAAADPLNYSSDDYGVPLSTPEVDDLLRRAAIQGDMDPWVERAATHADFAGAYIDQRSGGIPVFMFTGDLASRSKDMSAVVPPGTAFRVETANLTYERLTDLRDRIADSWPRLQAEGIKVVLTGILTSQNIVDVGVEGLTPEISQRLSDEFGAAIMVREEKTAQADACVSIKNCRPMKGGLEVKSAADNGQCTSGFVVKRADNGALHLLTAGHCIEAHGGYDVVWRHNNDGFGRARHDTWHVNYTRDGDVGLLTILTAETPATKNQIYQSGTTVRSVTGWDSVQYQGDQSCRVGVNSTFTCGVINAVNVKRASTTFQGTMWVEHTNQVSFDSTSGDSGGPMFFYSGSTVVAQGTHVHSAPDGSPNAYGWFTPIYWGRQAFSSLHNYDYLVCTNSACT